MKLEVTYMINEPLLKLLMAATQSSKQEVWSHMQDLSRKCFVTMDNESKMSSWTKTSYPGINIQLRIDVRREGYDRYPKPDIIKGVIKGNVKIALVDNNIHFSSKQVEEFLVEKILLGAK